MCDLDIEIGGGLIFGKTFFQILYVYFDLDNRRIGFA
jgi:hypothetical protein